MRRHMVRILQVFPVIFMMSVSIVAGIFVFSDDLSSWRGGTFGMFSSTDNRITRRIEVIAEIDGATQPLDLTPYRAQRDLVELLPTTPRLVQFMSAVACDVVPNSSMVSLRFLKLNVVGNRAEPIEVWRGRADGC